MSDATVAELERLAALAEAERTFHMTEDAFRVFYEWTARPLWLYLARSTGDDRLADDLLQEAFYRFLRTTSSFESDEHRRHYLFRIATNLMRDHHRRQRPEAGTVDDHPHLASGRDDSPERVVAQLDLSRAMATLTARERSLLWLAYGQGFSHQEIATTLGLRTGSLKALLFRARRRLLGVLQGRDAAGGRTA